jgi:hypothetical protein
LNFTKKEEGLQKKALLQRPSAKNKIAKEFVHYLSGNSNVQASRKISAVQNRPVLQQKSEQIGPWFGFRHKQLL